MKNEDLIKAFGKGIPYCKNNSLVVIGNILFSYGPHFPLLIRLESDNGYEFILNKAKYSQTTSKQQNFCRRIFGDKIIAEKTWAEMMSLKGNSGIKSVKDLVADSL